MKAFKKDKKGKLICEECNKKFEKKNDLFLHLHNEHNSIKSYLEKYIYDSSTNNN